MGGSNSRSKDKLGGSRYSLRKRVRHIIEQETAEEQDGFKFIGQEHVIGEDSGSSSSYQNQANCCLRILWFVVILTCTSTCFYQIWDRVAYFYTYPSYMSVKIEQRFNVSYPAITICIDPGTIMKYKQKAAAKHRTHPCDYLDVDMVDYNLTGMKKTADSMWRSWLNSDGQINRLNNLDVRFTLPKVKLQPETFIKTPFGTCVQDKTVHSSVEYRGTLTALVYYTVDYKPGCNYPQIIFGARDHFIDPSMARIFPASLMVAMPIKQQEFRGLNTPTNPCVSEDEYWDCITPCFETLMAENIECRLPYMVNVTKPACNSSPDARKAHKMAIKFMKRKYLDEKCGCPKRCNTTTYVIRTETIAIFPSLLIIYFPTNFVEISEEKCGYDFDQLTCDIGGNLGLFLGFCLLSLMNSIQQFVDILKVKLFRKRKGRVNTTAVSPNQTEPQNGTANEEHANVKM